MPKHGPKGNPHKTSSHGSHPVPVSGDAATTRSRALTSKGVPNPGPRTGPKPSDRS